VVLIVVDTLRADHVYGDRARTPNMDALARDGLRFTRTHPEAMPTVPARNSILSGHRVYPFRGWHPHRGLLDEPGWSPLGDVRNTFTSVLRRAGYWTACVTDNPFLGFAPPYADLRRSFDRSRRRGGQVGGSGAGVSDRELRHWLPPALEDSVTRARVRKYLANGRRTSRGRRRAATSTCTATRTTAARSPRSPTTPPSASTSTGASGRCCCGACAHSTRPR